jgi:hypothetical protein
MKTPYGLRVSMAAAISQRRATVQAPYSYGLSYAKGVHWQRDLPPSTDKRLGE